MGRNNPYAKNMREAYATALVGAGIKTSWLGLPPDLKAEIQDLWLRWSWEADADGICDWEGLQAMIARELWEAGEVFVRLRPRFASDPISVPLQLQVLPAEMLALNLNRMNGTNPVRQGVEFDILGRRVAYWFWRRHPGDSITQAATLNEPVRVPEDGVLHVFRQEQAGQIRGVPRLAPAMIPLKMLDDYDDAELARKRTTALFCGFVTEGAGEPVLEGDEKDEDDDIPLLPLQPETFQKLRPGEDVKFSEPADVGGNYEAFRYNNICRACAAVGMPHAVVSMDINKATYSSDRSGMVRWRQRIEQDQHSVVVFQLIRPVVREWVRLAYVSGRIDLPTYDVTPGQYELVKNITPAWPWVDPLNDAKAEELWLQLGVKAPSDLIEGQGYDRDEVYDRIADDQKARRARGLSFPTLEGTARISIGAPGGTPPGGIPPSGGQPQPQPRQDQAA
jgi:lambda family phage portal protein